MPIMPSPPRSSSRSTGRRRSWIVLWPRPSSATLTRSTGPLAVMPCSIAVPADGSLSWRRDAGADHRRVRAAVDHEAVGAVPLHRRGHGHAGVDLARGDVLAADHEVVVDHRRGHRAARRGRGRGRGGWGRRCAGGWADAATASAHRPASSIARGSPPSRGVAASVIGKSLRPQLYPARLGAVIAKSLRRGNETARRLFPRQPLVQFVAEPERQRDEW